MKTLFMYCDEFAYTPTKKTLDFVPDAGDGKAFKNAQTIFIQIEKEDEENDKSVFKKLVKQIKWIIKKNEPDILVLHSFAHLSDSKADPKFTMDFLQRLENRMNDSGIDTTQTPFGYFLDLKLDAPGFSLARVYKAF
jgi:hypothetical protein